MDKELTRVAETYEKYKVEIINCLDKKSRDFRYTTGIAECVNNHIKTIIKCAMDV
jgi:transposase